MKERMKLSHKNPEHRIHPWMSEQVKQQVQDRLEGEQSVGNGQASNFITSVEPKKIAQRKKKNIRFKWPTQKLTSTPTIDTA